MIFVKDTGLKLVGKYDIMVSLYAGVYFVPTSLIIGRVSSVILEVYLSIQNRQQETDELRHSPTCKYGR